MEGKKKPCQGSLGKTGEKETYRPSKKQRRFVSGEGYRHYERKKWTRVPITRPLKREGVFSYNGPIASILKPMYQKAPVGSRNYKNSKITSDHRRSTNLS